MKPSPDPPRSNHETSRHPHQNPPTSRHNIDHFHTAKPPPFARPVFSDVFPLAWLDARRSPARAGLNLAAISIKLAAFFEEKPPVSGQNAASSYEIERISHQNAASLGRFEPNLVGDLVSDVLDGHDTRPVWTWFSGLNPSKADIWA